MRAWIAVAVIVLAACAPETMMEEATTGEVSVNDSVATFAGGCFWCMEPPFENLEGVHAVVSGYAGGTEPSPTYEEVSSGATGYVEAVQVRYDPSKVAYGELLDVYWRQIDPTDDGGSFVDRGKEYRSIIFAHDAEQRALAEESKRLVQERFKEPVVTEIRDYTTFYPAEEYHQDYHEKNPIRYKFYRHGSGRDSFIESVWYKDNSSLWDEVKYVKPSEEEIKETLTPIQYEVTQEDGTEPAFQNEYWDNKEDGIYVDVVTGEPLFSSKDKYDSGTGWPSFTKPLDDGNVVTKKDFKLILPRTEARSKVGDSHLGHVFDDGPAPTGLRYCMNSAALRFIPKDRLDEEGYGRYLPLFE